MGGTIFSNSIMLFGKPLSITLSGYGLLVILTSIALYGIYVAGIRQRKDPPPIAAWGLWLVLDVVATGAEIARGVFNIQLLCYTVGTLVVCAALLRHPNKSWDKLWDTATAAIVGLSIVAWMATGEGLAGLIFSLLGMTIAAGPLVRAILKGADEPLLPWVLVAMGSFFNLLDGHVLSSVWLGVLQFAIIMLIMINRKTVAANS